MNQIKDNTRKLQHTHQMSVWVNILVVIACVKKMKNGRTGVRTWDLHIEHCIIQTLPSVLQQL